MPRVRVFACAVVVLVECAASAARANDAAAETAAGGLQLRAERRVTMDRERLVIAKRFVRRDPSNLPSLQFRYDVSVEYEFVNDSPEDVETEVAFPLPEYGYPGEDLIQDRRVRGFSVEVDGQPVPCDVQVAAHAGPYGSVEGRGRSAGPARAQWSPLERLQDGPPLSGRVPMPGIDGSSESPAALARAGLRR